MPTCICFTKIIPLAVIIQNRWKLIDFMCQINRFTKQTNFKILFSPVWWRRLFGRHEWRNFDFRSGSFDDDRLVMMRHDFGAISGQFQLQNLFGSILDVLLQVPNDRKTFRIEEFKIGDFWLEWCDFGGVLWRCWVTAHQDWGRCRRWRRSSLFWWWAMTYNLLMIVYIENINTFLFLKIIHIYHWEIITEDDSSSH